MYLLQSKAAVGFMRGAKSANGHKLSLLERQHFAWAPDALIISCKACRMQLHLIRMDLL